MSDFQLSNKSKIKEKQLAFLTARAREELGIGADQMAIDRYIQTVLSIYEGRLGGPLFSPRLAERHQLPFREDVTENMEEIVADMYILTQEHNASSRFLTDSFNIVHSEKKRLISRIGNLNNLVGDLMLLSGEQASNVSYFKESFQDANALDETYTLENVTKAHIAASEGILTLGRKSTVNLSESARVAQVNGNGQPGIGHIAKKYVTIDKEGTRKEAFHFSNQFEPDLHEDPSVLLDNRPDTLFEYQWANVPHAFKQERRNYDFGWAESPETGGRLRAKIVIELDEPQTVNWLSLNPYYASNAASKMTVYSIRTSADGFDYEPLYAEKTVLNQTLNNTPQTYQLDALFDGSNVAAEANYTGQGVWSFPQRTARFIEFVLDQDQSYNEIIGQEVYRVKRDGQTLAIQIPAPEELKTAEPGEYVRTIDGERLTYSKTIEATDEGWRYAIGIRDIQVMQYQFEEKSYFVSQRYFSKEPIGKVMLYANEIIPHSYLDIVSKNNDWIVYEVSFDDTNWIRISPMHQEPLTEAFPAKILEANGAEIDLASAFQIHKELVQTADAHHLRLKITLSRPIDAGFENTTPLLEDVALKIEKRGAL